MLSANQDMSRGPTWSIVIRGRLDYVTDKCEPAICRRIRDFGRRTGLQVSSGFHAYSRTFSYACAGLSCLLPECAQVPRTQENPQEEQASLIDPVARRPANAGLGRMSPWGGFAGYVSSLRASPTMCWGTRAYVPSGRMTWPPKGVFPVGGGNRCDRAGERVR